MKTKTNTNTTSVDIEGKEITRTLTFDGGITEESIIELKKQFRKVFRINVVDGNETHVGYFKRPDFATVKAVTKLAKTDEVESGRVMFKNCWLGGSKYLEEDAVLFMAVQVQLGKLLNGCMGSIKNL